MDINVNIWILATLRLADIKTRTSTKLAYYVKVNGRSEKETFCNLSESPKRCIINASEPTKIG
jgi:hypothetical protein